MSTDKTMEGQWRDEFVNTVMIDHRLTITAINDVFINKSIQAKWEVYLAARKKAQSETHQACEMYKKAYLRDQLKTDEIQKLKEEMALKNHSLRHFIDACQEHLVSIGERDKLLEQAATLIDGCYIPSRVEIAKWYEDYQELRK